MLAVATIIVIGLPIHARGDDPDPTTPTLSANTADPSVTPFERAAGVQRDRFYPTQDFATSAGLLELRPNAVLQHDLPLGGDFALRTELFSTDVARPDFEREGTGGSIELGTRVARATRVFARYRLEQVSTSPFDAQDGPAEGGPPPTWLAPRRQRIATLGAGIAYDTRDGRGLHGSYLALLAEASHPQLGSDARFVRVRATAETAQPIGPFTLRLHGHVGYVRSSDAMGVPLSERLFHDGVDDVRGYQLATFGAPRGDNTEAVGRAELELPISRKAGLSIVVFADAAVRQSFDVGAGMTGPRLVRSVGASLIWRSPIGPLRLDFAVPLDGSRRARELLLSASFVF